MAVMISSHQHSILKSHPHMQRAVRIVVALPTYNYHKILQPKAHLQFCCILASISEIDETAWTSVDCCDNRSSPHTNEHIRS